MASVDVKTQKGGSAGKATLDSSGLSLVSGDSMADAAEKVVKTVD